MIASVITLPLLLAAGTFAKPHAGAGKHLNKRAVVTETDYTVVYETVYVTEGAAAAEATSSAAPARANNNLAWTGGDWSNWRHGSKSASAVATTLSTLTLSSTTTVAAGTQTIVSSTPVAAPAPSSTSTSTISSSVLKSATSAQPASTKASSTSTSTSSAAASSSTGSANRPSQDYINRVLLHHNVHRANHSAPDAVWSDSMYAIALAEASVCVYAHNTSGGGGGYGQNIAAGVPASNVQAVITDLFYNGEVNWYDGQYGLANPSFDNFGHWGHFSQVVWKASTNIACATVDCSASGLKNVGSGVSPHFTVCNYQAVGNMGGEYGANIGKSLGRPSVSSSYTG